MFSSSFLLTKDRKRQSSIKIDFVSIFLDQDRYNEHAIRQFDYDARKEYRNKFEVRDTSFRNYK